MGWPIVWFAPAPVAAFDFSPHMQEVAGSSPATITVSRLSAV